MTVEEASAQLADLERKLAAHRVKASTHEAAIAAVSLGAQTGAPGARRKLDEMIAEAPAIDAEARSIEYAIKAARAVLADARAAEAREADRRRAEKVRAILARFLTRGAALDEGLRQAKEAYAGLQDDLREIAAMGVPAPSAALVDVNMRRALDAAIGGMHSKIRPVPPSQRHGFAELCKGWAQPSERWAAQALGEPVKQGEAA
jgi:hypothetical protein